MSLVPRRSTTRALALFATVALAASVWGGVASARTRTVRNFSVSMSPCVLPGGATTLSATFTNSGNSTQNLGSIFLDTSELWFTGIMPDSAFVVSPGWTGHLESAFGFAGDRTDYDGLYLTANSSASALAPGASVSVTFPVSVGSRTGNTLWLALGWTGTTPYTGSLFNLASTKVNVTSSCVGAPANIAFVSGHGPSDTPAGQTMAPVQVLVTDASNNPIPNQTVTLGGTGFTSPASSSNSGGVATFSSIQVSTTAGDYSMSANDGALTTGLTPFKVLPGAAEDLTFAPPNGTQPTDTEIGHCINSSDCSAGGVQVYVTDHWGNAVADGTNATVSLGTDPTMTLNPPSHATLGGTTMRSTADGVAAFPDLTIDKTSSGFTLHAVAGAASGDSASFAITNTPPDGCTNDQNCTVSFSDTSSVTAPVGTTLIIETNQLNCGNAVANPIAGTVTIIPPSGPGGIPIQFDDVISFPITGPYPFCKALTFQSTPSIVPFCDTVNGLDQHANGVACLTQAVTLHGGNPPTLRSILWINDTDPIGKH